jgi:dynein heavy chain
MSPQCKIIFEPHNIDNASPATVSRNGMVYMSSSGLDWRPILQGWLNKRSVNEAEIIKNLFDKSFQDLLDFASNSLVFKISVLECNHIAQVSLMIRLLIRCHPIFVYT